MICPRCEIGVVEKITFKKSKEKANICGSCGTVWLMGDIVRFDTGHEIMAFEDFELDNPIDWPDEEAVSEEEDSLEDPFANKKFL